MFATELHPVQAPRIGLATTLMGLLLTASCTTGPSTPTAQPIAPPPHSAQDPPQIVTAQPTATYEATIPVQKLDGKDGAFARDAAGHDDIMQFIERVESARRAYPHPATEPGAANPATAGTSPRKSPVIGVLRAPREPEIPAAAENHLGPERLDSQIGPAATQPEPRHVAAREEQEDTPPTTDTSVPRIREVVTAASIEPQPIQRLAPSPALNTPATAQIGPRTLREYLANQPQPAGDSSFRAQLDQRILWLLAGEDDRALLPLSEVAQAQQELAGRYLAALRVIRDAHLGDLGGAAGRAARELDALREQLAELGDLSIPTLVLCRAVRGFGQYEPLEPARFVAGRENEFVVYCEVQGFSSERRSDGWFHLHFDLTTTVLDESGQTRFELHDPDITDQSRNRRQDCFLPRLVRLPAGLPAGRYTLKVVLTDRIGRKVVERSTPFELTRGG